MSTAPFSFKSSVLEDISSYFELQADQKVLIKRDDLIDDLVSGNKWRKLKYNIEKAKQLKVDGILTFGGAHSNHLVATAKACYKLGLKSIGIVRGEELNKNANPTLKNCAVFGMELQFISREEYGMRNDKEYKDQLHIENPNYYIVPEGGANFYGAVGCQEIIKELPNDVTDIVVSAGTGTTAVGLLLGAKEHQTIHVVSALKGNWMSDEVEKLLLYSLFDKEVTEELLSKANFVNDAHFGGYAKYKEELGTFISNFYKQTAIKLDFTYTAKSMFWLVKQIKEQKFSNHSKIAFIHTGGIQAMTYFQEQKGIDLFA